MVQAQGSSSESKPKDMTPHEYEALRPLVASILTNTLGASFAPGVEGENKPLNMSDGWQGIMNSFNTTPSTVTPGATGGYTNPFTMTLQDYYANNDTSALVAQMTPEEVAAYKASLAGFAPGLAQYDKTIAGDYLSPDSNPFLRDYIKMAQRPLLEAYDDKAMEERAMFGRAGHKIQESSPFATASAKLSGDLLSTLRDVGTSMSYENYTQERDRQVAAVKQRFDLAKEQLQLSALPRMIKELGLERGQAEFQRQMENMMNILMVAAGLSEPTVANTQKSAGGGGGIYSTGSASAASEGG